MRIFFTSIALLTCFISTQALGVEPTLFAPSNQQYLYAYQNSMTPTLQDCEKNWKVISKNSSVCEVNVYNSKSHISLDSRSLIDDWTYYSTQNWYIDLFLSRTASGYKIQVIGSHDTPPEYLNFNIAQKYVASLLTHWGKKSFNNLSMSTSFLNQNFAGDVWIAKRSVHFSSKELFENCLKQITPENPKQSCMLHFAKNTMGEVALTQNKIVSSATDGRTEYKLTLASQSGWQNLGSFNMAYYRIDFKGELNLENLFKLHQQALNKIQNEKFEFYVQKIGSKPENSTYFTEQLIEKAQLTQFTWSYNKQLCRANWKYSRGRGFCNVPITQLAYFLETASVKFNTTFKVKNEHAVLYLQTNYNSYTLEVYGSETAVAQFDKLAELIDENLKKAPSGTFNINTLSSFVAY